MTTEGLHILPDGWKWLLQPSVFTYQGGGQPPASEFVGQKLDGYVRLIQIRDYYTDSHITYVPDSSRLKKCTAEDVMIARYGSSDKSSANSLGRICRGLDGAYNVALAKTVPRDGIEREFLFYLLQSDYFQHPLKGSSARSVQAGFNKATLATIEFPIPPLPEQQAIAEVLGALDDKIELNRKMNVTLDELARTIFRSWFVDFDPVRAKMEGREPFGMDAETAALFPDRLVDSPLGPIPEGWDASTLNSVIEIHDSKRIPLSSRQRAERRGPYPYHGATGILDHVDDYLFEGVHVLVGEDGSVVNDDGTPVVQYVWDKFWVNNHAHVLTAAHGISNEHLSIALRNTNVQPYVTGAVQAKINQANLKQIPFTKAPNSINASFGRVVKPFFELFRANTEESRTLAELRDTLLPELISGRIRVPEAERLVGEAI